MKVILFPCVLAFAYTFTGCRSTNNQQVQKLKEIVGKDSSMLAMGNKEDSEMTYCLGEMNEIGNNLEHITFCENTVILQSAEMKPGYRALLAAGLSELDDLVIATGKKINLLQLKIHNLTLKNVDFESLTARLARQMEIKKEEVILLQARLCKADNSLQIQTNRFNDSLVKITQQISQELLMKNGLNTGYYANGTMKELRNKGIINKEGQFSGIKKAYETNSGIDNSNYIKTDLTNLKGLELSGKFDGLITAHPESSYEVIRTGKTDSISITNPFAFWCESKYLVVAVK